MWFSVTLLLVLAVGCLVRALWPLNEGARQARRDRFAVSLQVYVAPPDHARVDTALARRHRARLICIAAALVAAAILVALFSDLRAHSAELIVPGSYLAALSAAGIGNLLGELAPRLRQEETPRTARLRSTAVGDFVHPAMRAYLGIVAGVGLLIPLTAGLDIPAVEGFSLLAALFPAVLFLGCEALSRAIIRLPQPATGPGELYLADSLRADALWSSYWFSSLFSLMVLVGGTTGAAYTDAWGLDVAALLLAAIVPGVLALRPRWSQLRYRERLWPELPIDSLVSTATGVPVA